MEQPDGSTTQELHNYYHDTLGRVAIAPLFTDMKDLLSAMHAVDCVGFCHTDVKPGNILLGLVDKEEAHRFIAFWAGGWTHRPLRLKLADWGGALALFEEKKSVTSLLQRGTDGFIAVEQRLQRLCGSKQDIVSFALVFYQSWTGKLPSDNLAEEVMCDLTPCCACRGPVPYWRLRAYLILRMLVCSALMQGHALI